MYVEVNTSNGIENKETLQRWATDYLNEHLAKYAQDVTTVEVQLTDENHVKGGNDKRCMLEARLPGRTPVAVTNIAVNQDLAFRGAAEKLDRALEHALGKLDREHRDRESIRKDASVLPGQ
ncbi:HPF/RaiA family ribosome-associated protein [Ramlibacter albus]|uniref:HPF/RaiA family ribosome-associated protein n=1 Tax=Ramlibacter albus TaxID=2079448 RepID=A0A923MBL4_9BURK|nr:HPF/RaiA family ribosome-associated protein [Ramlibacter albus]MBC5767388.1 HPF/RaiA family ribosome-associated protein [Ramlibacter albus]